MYDVPFHIFLHPVDIDRQLRAVNADGLEDYVEYRSYLIDDDRNQDINRIFSPDPPIENIQKAAFAPNGSLFCAMSIGALRWFPSNLTMYNSTKNGEIIRTIKTVGGNLGDLTVMSNGTLVYANGSKLEMVFPDFSTLSSPLLTMDSNVQALRADSAGNVFIATMDSIYILDDDFNLSDTEASLHLLLDGKQPKDLCVNKRGDVIFVNGGWGNSRVYVLPSNYSFDAEQNGNILFDLYDVTAGVMEIKEICVDSRLLGMDDALFIYETLNGGGSRIVMIHPGFDRQKPINAKHSIESVYESNAHTLQSMVLGGRDVYFTNMTDNDLYMLKYSETSMINYDTDRDGLWDGISEDGHLGELDSSHHPDQWDHTFQQFFRHDFWHFFWNFREKTIREDLCLA